MAVESAQHHIRPESARKVWIFNDYEKDHVEEFRGEKWVIPANGKILKPVLEANKFLSQAIPPSIKRADGSYLRPPKALRLVELTEEERERLEGVNKESQKTALQEQNVKVSLTCMKCGFLSKDPNGLDAHVKAKHPELEPFKKE